MTEREKVSRSIFDKLPEPYKSQCNNNFDLFYSLVTPTNEQQALGSGFDWEKSPEGSGYWETFYWSCND